MRLGIIAAANPSTTDEPVMGERDASLIEDRCMLDDLAFEVRRVDPAIDLAEQIDDLLREPTEELSSILLYVSCLAAVVDEDECYLCLDPDNADVGDSLGDVASLLVDVGVAVLVVAELRCEDEAASHADLNALLAAVRTSVPAAASVIAAVRPRGAHPERVPSRMTAALLETLDESDGALSARNLYAKAIQIVDPGSWLHAEMFSPGEAEMWLRYRVAADAPPAAPAEADAAPGPAGPLPGAEPPSPDLDEPVIETEQVHPRAPEELGGGVASAAAAPSTPRRRKPLRPAPPSERKQVATQSVRHRKRRRPTPTGLPKVVIGRPPEAMRAYAAEMSPRRSGHASTAAATPQAKRGGGEGELGTAASPAPERVVGDGGDSVAASTDRLNDAAARPIEPDVAPPPETAAPAPATAADAAETAAPEPVTVAEDVESAAADAPEVAKAAPTAASDTIEAQAAGRRLDGVDIEIDDDVPVVQVGEPSVAAEQDDFEDIEIEDEEPSGSVTPPPTPSRKTASEMSASDHADAGDGHRRLGDLDKAVKEYKKALGKLGTAATPERGEVYLRLAQVMREQGKDRLAISNYDKALSINPANLQALEALIALNAAAGNWRAVNSAEQRFFAAELDDDTRLAQLLAAGDRWREQAGDLKRARDRYTQARDRYGDQLGPLQRLALLYEAEHAVDQVVATRETMAQLGKTPRERATALFELGEYCMFEAKREQAALDAFRRALEADPTMLEALEMVATMLAEGQEWAELESVYGEMIEAFQEQTDEAALMVVAELHRRMALLHRDHLEDPASALSDLQRELAIRPDQLSAQLLAAEVATELERGDEAVSYLRASAWLDPARSETYRQLFELGLGAHDPDQSFLAASVGVILGSADKQQFVVYRAHRLEGLPSPTRAMRPAAWGWLRDEARSAPVDRVMAAVMPVVLRMRVAQLEADGKLPTLPAAGKQDPDKSTVSVVRALSWGCQFLGMAPPVIYLSEDVAGGFTAPFAREATTLIGREVHSGITMVQRAFLVGRHVALRQAEHELVAHLSSVDEITVCFLAALHLATGREPTSTAHAVAVSSVARGLGEVATEAELAAIRDAVKAFEAAGGRARMKGWVASVERCATRAGLLLCGDLETAVQMVRAAGDHPWVSADALIDDLYAFTVSAQHIKLRQEIGTSLAQSPERPALDGG